MRIKTWSREDALASLILADGQGWWIQSPGRLQYGNVSLVYYNIIPRSSDCLAAQPTSCVLSCTPSYPNGSDKVIWGSSEKSSGPQIRFVGPTVRLTSLLLGRTHLSGTVVSMVGGDLGVPSLTDALDPN
jgi:hypothetical protein